MNDRFALALMLSLGMHALLLGMAVALGTQPEGKVQLGEVRVIPVSLYELATGPEPSPHGGENGARRATDRVPVAPAAAIPAVKPATPARIQPPSPAQSLRSEQSAAPAAKALSPDLAAEPAATIAHSSSTVLLHSAEGPAAVGPPGAEPGEACLPAASPDSGAAGGGGRGLVDGAGGGAGAGPDGPGSQGAALVAAELLAGNPPPRYPLLARRKGWEGTVVIEAGLSGSGRVQVVHIEKSSGYAILDDAAVGAVRSWRLAQGGRLGTAGLKVMIPVVFRLEPAASMR